MHNVRYARHLDYQRKKKKKFAAIKRQYFWSGMKKDVVDYIAMCMEFERVKVDHRHLASLLQPFSFPKKKWEVVTVDSITKLLGTSK
jgi:hypothetical protein